MDMDNLLVCALNKDWKGVVAKYQCNQQVHYAKIPSVEFTMLHVAVYLDAETNIVKQLVRSVVDPKVLEIKNDMGNTPLHLAAAKGKVAMCKCMVEKNKALLAVRNNEGDTPLFVAALRGQKSAFRYLHGECPEGHDRHYWSRNDGNTILHVAILGEYFDLAWEIIKKYTREDNAPLDLINFSNARGQSALHLLANNPSAFESGNRLGRLDRIIYDGIVVVDLPEETPKNSNEEESPQNYKTFDLWALLKKPFHFLQGVPKWPWTLQCFQQGDPENPQNPSQGQACTDGSSAGSNKNESEGQSPNNRFQPYYAMCCSIFELVPFFFLQVLGYGLIRTSKLKEKKQKHRWAVQVMDILVSRAYNATGRKPPVIGPSRWTIDAIKKKEDKKKEEKKCDEHDKKEDMGEEGGSPLLVAAKMGVIEIVIKILDCTTKAIEDVDQYGRNALLLAVENKQAYVFQYLCGERFSAKVFEKVDFRGNNALHLAAEFKPGLMPGGPLQMHSEIKWHQFVKETLKMRTKTALTSVNLVEQRNYNRQTHAEVFRATHRALVQQGISWMMHATQYCSVVAALIATVAFATATAVPGKGETGTTAALMVFTIASVIALSFSVASLIILLAIILVVLSSKYEEATIFAKLVTNLIVGLTCLFVSIVAMLISYFASLSYVLKYQLHISALPLYVSASVPVIITGGLAVFPPYYHLIKFCFSIQYPSPKIFDFRPVAIS